MHVYCMYKIFSILQMGSLIIAEKKNEMERFFIMDGGRP